MQSITSITPCYVNYCRAIDLKSAFAQSVRFWKRKPMWLPPAKSKMFRVPKRRPKVEDEDNELHRLYCNYRTYYRSIREYLKQDAEKKTVLEDQSVLDKIEEEDFKRCSEINDTWNESILQIRNVRLSEEWEVTKKTVANYLENFRIAKEESQREADEEIRQAIEDSATFITSENIDQAIDQALETVISYDDPIVFETVKKFRKDPIPLLKSSRPTEVTKA